MTNENVENAKTEIEKKLAYAKADVEKARADAKADARIKQSQEWIEQRSEDFWHSFAIRLSLLKTLNSI